jgi:cob(I)alamin adenosyltransferase
MEQRVLPHLEWVQHRLFSLSSMLATVNLPTSTLPSVSPEDIAYLEAYIDRMNEDLPELKNFILSGGSLPVSYLHLARTVCRRAERVCTLLHRDEPLHPLILSFLNRLSDDLFMMARWVGFQYGESDKLVSRWVGMEQPPLE